MLIFNLARPFSVFYLMHKSIGQRKLCFHLNVFFDLFFSLSHKSMAQLLLFFCHDERKSYRKLTFELATDSLSLQVLLYYTVCVVTKTKIKREKREKGKFISWILRSISEKAKKDELKPKIWTKIFFFFKLFTIEYAERKRFIWLFFSSLFSPFCMCKTISTWFSLEGKLKC